MALNLTQKLTISFTDLLNDAVERTDWEALNFLEEERNKMVKRTKADGTEAVARQAIPTIRAMYLQRFHNTTPSKVESKAYRRDMNALAMAKAKMATSN
jgi:hypothetical protein